MAGRFCGSSLGLTGCWTPSSKLAAGIGLPWFPSTPCRARLCALEVYLQQPRVSLEHPSLVEDHDS